MNSSLDDVVQLDVSYLKKAGLLSKGKASKLNWIKGDKIVLANVIIYIEENHMEMVGGTIHFTRTSCNFGGKRIWFLCPECGRRSRILYGINFVCRLCVNVPYGCIGEDRLDRINRKIGKFKSIAFDDADIKVKPKQKHRVSHYKNIDKYTKYLSIRQNIIKKIFVFLS